MSLVEERTSKKPSAPAAPPDDPDYPTVSFDSDRCTNMTHQSTTDPEARLTRKSVGKEATLSFSGHVLMENRYGLCMDLLLAPATGTGGTGHCAGHAALPGPMRDSPHDDGRRKGYHCRNFWESVVYGRC